MAHKFQAMWDATAESFREQTGQSIKKDPPTTFEDCIKAIEERQQLSIKQEPEEKSKIEAAKTHVLHVIEYLKVFGGIASQAADAAFPASSLCFNAILFLLDIPTDIHDFHIAVKGLFETIGPTLNHFKMYDEMEEFDNLDSGLLLTIHQLMICFVDICKLSVKLRQSKSFREKLKTKTKLVLLKDDSGIQELLNRLESLSKDHSRQQGTQILILASDSNSRLRKFLDRTSLVEKAVLETQVNVTRLNDSNERREIKESSRDSLKMIKEKLGIDDEVTSSARLCEKLWKASVSGTGDWIRHLPEYSNWAPGINSQESSVLFLSGGPSTGKSILTSIILHRLKEEAEGSYQPASGRLPRILTGSYFFSTEKSGAGKDGEDIKPLHTAIKSMAYQLAEQDPVFETALSQTCNRKGVNNGFLRDINCKKLWELLGIGSPKGHATHYLLFDGLADLESHATEAVNELMEIIGSMDQTKSSVRILVSMRPEIPKPLSSQHLEIVMESHNEDDLRVYIDDRLKKMDILQEPNEVSTRVKKKVLGLSAQVKGNYYNVNAALERVFKIANDDGTENEVDMVLEASREGHNTMFQSQIAELELALSAQEICELNELLIWTIFIKRINVTVDILKAALFLRFRKHPIQPLEKKLRAKYSKVLSVTDNKVVEVVDGMREFLIKPRLEPRRIDETPRFSATITITKGDRTNVQSFLWQLMHKINTYDLVPEDSETRKPTKESIQVNEFDAHLTIVRRILQLIDEDPNPNTEALGKYALCFLPDHLSDLKNAEVAGPDSLKPSEKREIGNGLYKLFSHPNNIEKHWKSCGWVVWYGTKEEIAIFLSWLADESVTGHLGYRDRIWLKDTVAKHKTPARPLLSDLMNMLARRWLQDSSWEAPTVFWWLERYLTMVGLNDNNNNPNGVGDAPGNDTTSGPGSREMTVAEVENWCQREFFKGIEPGSLWYERLGSTYHGRREIDRAADSYRKAIDLHSQNPLCFERLAEYLGTTLDGLYGIRGAITEAEKTAKSIEKDESPDKGMLIDIYLRLADLHYRLGQQQPAIEYTDKVLNLEPDQVEVQYRLLRICLLNSSRETYAKFWRRLTRNPEDQHKTGSLTAILQQLTSDENSEDLIMNWFSLMEAGDFQTFLDETAIAIDIVQRQGQSDVKAQLLLYEGIARHYSKDTGTLTGTDIDSWNQCLEQYTVSTRYLPQLQASTLISAHHFDRFRAEENFASKEKHIQRLRELALKNSPFVISATKAYLASAYRFKNVEQAKEVLRGSMSSALDMLSDDEIENDLAGYSHVAQIALSCGDELNALSAYSQFLGSPPGNDPLGWVLDFDLESARAASRDLQVAIKAKFPDLPIFAKQLEFALEHIDSKILSAQNSNDTGNVSNTKGLEEVRSRLRRLVECRTQFRNVYVCDGPCGRLWDFENPIFVCKYCCEVTFCPECLEKLKRGNERIFSFGGIVCKKDHDWLYLPKREKKEWMECLMGNVRVGGRLENGVRKDGKLVTVSEWLDTVKREWGWGSEDIKMDSGDA
ncbi:hypothetical protein F5Y04DRAFT_239985 [Hypomontagnella monticulosa]|nr:hypothetical protein F5Y04DRAFT_239985 [Hypomontagnella monticulosa]